MHEQRVAEILWPNREEQNIFWPRKRLQGFYEEGINEKVYNFSMGIPWLTIAIAAGLFSNLTNFCARYALRKDKDPASFALGLEISRVLLFALLAFFDFQLIISWKSILILSLLGLVEPVSIYLFMKMHEYNQLSISSIISRSRMVWVAALAFIFLGESLRTMQYVGILILFLGLSIAVSPHRFFLDKGIRIATLSTIVAAIIAILIKSASVYASVPVLMVWMSLPSLFIFPLVIKDSKKRLYRFVKQNVLATVGFTGSSFFAMYGYVFAVKHGSVSIATSIYHAMIIVAVIAGIVVLGEKEDVAKKIIGALVTIAGILLLTV